MFASASGTDHMAGKQGAHVCQLWSLILRCAASGLVGLGQNRSAAFPPSPHQRAAFKITRRTALSVFVHRADPATQDRLCGARVGLLKPALIIQAAERQRREEGKTMAGRRDSPAELQTLRLRGNRRDPGRRRPEAGTAPPHSSGRRDTDLENRASTWTRREKMAAWRSGAAQAKGKEAAWGASEGRRWPRPETGLRGRRRRRPGVYGQTGPS